MDSTSGPLHLQTVIIKKVPGMTLERARRLAQKVIQNRERKFYREKPESYHFRNIPKTEMVPGSYVSKKVSEVMTLVFGRLL
jgi:hypothetical protein